MGLFKTPEKEKTELQKFIEELPKQRLENDIEVIEDTINYAKDINEGKIINPFDSESELISVLIKYVNTHMEKTETITDFIAQVKNVLSAIYVDKINEEDFDYNLNIFNKDGVYENNLFDINLYRMFNNVLEYIIVTKSIIEKNLKENFDLIKDFLIDIRCKFDSSDDYYYYSLSFLNKITYGTDLQKLIEKEKTKLNKKDGIYDIDETALDLLFEKTISAEGIISELESLVKRADRINRNLNDDLDSYKAKLIEINMDSLKNYHTSLEKDLEELKDNIRKAKEEIANYAVSQRESISSSIIDEQNKIIKSLNEEKDKIIASLKRFEETLTTIALAKTSEISRLGQEQINSIDTALTNAPHIREILSDMTGLVTDKKVLETLGELSKLDLKNLISSPNILTPASGLVVSSPNVIIPEEPVDFTVNKYFDKNRSMTSRLEELKEKMEKNSEEKGIIYHSKTMYILEYILYGLAPYLYGPSGGGKSMAVTLIADLLELPISNIGYINEEYQVTGAEPFLNNFTPSMMHKAFKYGGLAFADELDNGNARATVILNPFLRKTTTTYTFSNRELVKRHPNFRLIAAGNTDGRGASKNHSTREGIEESVFQRLKPKVYIGYDPTIEKSILKDHPEWYNFVIAFRSALASYSQLNEGEITLADAVTTSDITDIRDFLNDGVLTIEEIIQGDFIQAKNKEYLDAINASLESYYKKVSVTKEEMEIYRTFERCSKEYILKRELR